MTTFEAFEQIDGRNHCTIVMHGNHKGPDEAFQMRILMGGCESHSVEMLKMAIDNPEFRPYLMLALRECGYHVLHESDVMKN